MGNQPKVVSHGSNNVTPKHCSESSSRLNSAEHGSATVGYNEYARSDSGSDNSADDGSCCISDEGSNGQNVCDIDYYFHDGKVVVVVVGGSDGDSDDDDDDDSDDNDDYINYEDGGKIIGESDSGGGGIVSACSLCKHTNKSVHRPFECFELMCTKCVNELERRGKRNECPFCQGGFFCYLCEKTYKPTPNGEVPERVSLVSRMPCSDCLRSTQMWI
jgi:hypothetical protein